MARQRRRRGRTATRKAHPTLTGTLHVVRAGTATVETAEGTFTVARGGIREGMDGDEVTIGLVRRGHGGDPFAVVQGVITRGTSSLLGTYDKAEPLGVVRPLDGRITHDFFILPDDLSAMRTGSAPGDLVCARILTYPTRHEAGVATIERRVGATDELDLAMETVIATHGLATEFGMAALGEANALTTDVEAALATGRRHDLRDDCVITIDPTDARDFDDAVSARRRPDGGFDVGVHIADVTHYVRWDDHIDLEARSRTCSAYLADRVLPMLPERLSNDLCSLRPGEDRLCMSVFLTLDKQGNVVSSSARRTVIRSCARLTYDEVDALLAGTLKAPELNVCAGIDATGVADMLTTLADVARRRELVRAKRGAVDFATREAKVMLGERGIPTGVRVRTKTAATSLVEEAMLMANEAVAGMLAEAGVRAAYRAHERPAPDDLAAIVPVLRELGTLTAGETDAFRAGDPDTLRSVLARSAGTPSAVATNTLLLRAQRRAAYVPENVGHYALGAPAYCHFTSPIRRYPDVIVHRALKALLDATRLPDSLNEALPQLCRTCSEQERVADAAAYASQKAKMAELYATRVGERVAGIVVGVERFGLFIMDDETCAEGLLPVRALGDEWFAHDEVRMELVGESTGQRWHLGRRVAVEVAGTDPTRGQIDFRLAR